MTHINDIKYLDFTTVQAAEIVGITYRQIDYWARTDLVRPSRSVADGSGSRRVYSYNDVLCLRLVKRLLDEGVRLESVRNVVAEIKALIYPLLDGYIVIADRAAMYTAANDVANLVRRNGGVGVVASVQVIANETSRNVMRYLGTHTRQEQTT